MKTILLPAGLSSDLDWSLQLKEAAGHEQILWEFDFGFSAGAVLLNDKAAFHSYVLAIEQFGKLSTQSKRVVLYRGSLDIVKRIVMADDLVDAATMFGDYLHRLASFLPDDAIPYCLFEGSPFGKALSAQLMSKERFWHLHLAFEENQLPRGLLLPSDEACTEEVLEKLEILLNENSYRIIPEKRLNEMWDGLDQLYVIEEAVSQQGKRQVMGFIAAEGEVIRLPVEACNFGLT